MGNSNSLTVKIFGKYLALTKLIQEEWLKYILQIAGTNYRICKEICRNYTHMIKRVLMDLSVYLYNFFLKITSNRYKLNLKKNYKRVLVQDYICDLAHVHEEF